MSTVYFRQRLIISINNKHLFEGGKYKNVCATIKYWICSRWQFYSCVHKKPVWEGLCTIYRVHRGVYPLTVYRINKNVWIVSYINSRKKFFFERLCL